MRRSLGFAEPDGGWLGGVVGDRRTNRRRRDMTISSARRAQAATSPRPWALPGLALARRLRLLPAWAGICYVAAWAAGLASWPANLALNATNAQVAAAYRAHPAGAVSQFLLSEGLA